MTMTALKWIAGLALASLVSCAPANAPAPDGSDVGSQFVADLIANASQAEQPAAEKRFFSCSQDDSLVVNVGYAKYRGYHNASTGLNYWRGYEVFLWLSVDRY